MKGGGVNATQSTNRLPRTRPRGWRDRPALDWVVVGLVAFGVLWGTPLVRLFTGTGQDGQRSAIGSTASVLGTIAGFSVAVLFFYSALDNPATRHVRTEWGGHLAGVFLRALAVIFLASVVCGLTAVSVPNRAGAVVFFVAMLAGFVKLIRLILIVAALLHGQRHDAQQKPIATVRTTRRPVD